MTLYLLAQPNAIAGHDSGLFEIRGEYEVFHTSYGIALEGEFASCHLDPSPLYHVSAGSIDLELGGCLNTGYLEHLGLCNDKGELEECAGACEDEGVRVFARGVNADKPRELAREHMKRRIQPVLRIPELQENGEVEILSTLHGHVYAIHGTERHRFAARGMNAYAGTRQT